MGGLREIPFRALHHHPGQGQGAPVIDHAHHQADTATPHDTAIQHEQERVLGQRGQQGLGNGQKPPVHRVYVVFEPAPEACDQAFLIRRPAGRVISDRAQMRTVPARQPTDQGDERIQMAFLMPAGAGVIQLHQGLFYGTIAAIRVTHGLLQTVWSQAWKSIPEVARIAAVAHIFCTVVKL